MEKEFNLNPCNYVRTSCFKAMKNSNYVSINQKAITSLVNEILTLNQPGITFPKWSESHFPVNSVSFETLLRYVFIIDTLNFCFWPNPPFEYSDLAQNLHETLLHNPSFFEISSLTQVTSAELKQNIFKVEFCLLEERARMLREVFTVISDKYESSCVNFVTKAKQNAAMLVKMIIDEFVCFRDTAIYKGEQIFFYKRAQILVSDIHLIYKDLLEMSNNKSSINEYECINFGNTVSQLTMFADYRVPQILRSKNVLIYNETLSNIISNKNEIEHGSKYEVEIRAGTVVAVELIKEELAKNGMNVLSLEIDVYLWEEGEKQRNTTEHPAHRTLSIFY